MEPQPIVSTQPVTPVVAPTHPKWPWIFGGIVLLVLVGTAGIFIGKQKTSPPVLPTPVPTLIPEATTVPPSSETPATSTSLTYTIPAGWLKYTDSGSGISISYPAIYTAKYNDNRGFGTGTFQAGSYLVDNQGQDIMDFYNFAYAGGSRREEFYKALDWDFTVAEISKYTLSAQDLTLNGRSFLKLTMNFGGWHEGIPSGVEKRVFYLTTEGNRIVYFTYPLAKENADLTKIIATAQYLPATTIDDTQKVTCFASSYGQPNPSWSGQILSDGSMQIIQKTDVVLSDKPADNSRISIWANYQNNTYNGVNINGFSVIRDASLKGSYADAFVIKITKAEVDKIKAQTPASVASIAVLVKISGGIPTADNKACYTGGTIGYFAAK